MNSILKFSISFKSVDWQIHWNTFFWGKHCFGLLFCWKIQSSSSCKESKLPPKILWYIVRFMVPSITWCVLMPLRLKQKHLQTLQWGCLSVNHRYIHLFSRWEVAWWDIIRKFNFGFIQPKKVLPKFIRLI